MASKKNYLYNYDAATGEYLGCVYLYTNTTAGSEYNFKYIGCTTNEYERRAQWNSSSTHYAGSRINEARQKYGKSSFSYVVLVELRNTDIAVLKKEIEEWEAIYISYYNSVSYGYNMSAGGSGGKGMKRSEKTRELISASRKRPVKFIVAKSRATRFFESITDAITEMKISRSSFYKALKNNEEWNGYQIAAVI